MTILEEARRQLDILDQKMTELFETNLTAADRSIKQSSSKQLTDCRRQRLEIIRRIALYKKEHQLPIYNPQRETELIERNCRLLHDQAHRPAYLVFIQTILQESKAYQAAIFTSQDPDEQ
ncbi:MAG: chorismate mutase [Erysipelotrichaceae bacterium]|nr:chorismate mutase [Erysipelotrichaceae bacterium]